MFFRTETLSCSGLMFSRIIPALAAMIVFSVLLTSCAQPTTDTSSVSPVTSSGAESSQSFDEAAPDTVSSSDKSMFLPEATNDTIFSIIGTPDDENAERSIEAKSIQESYPIGTKSIELIITNHSDRPLLYTSYYDFRVLQNNEWISLTPREGALSNPDSMSANATLEAGASVTVTLDIDVFDEPLKAGVYRAAQLAPLMNEDGSSFACTEIVAAFTIE